MGRPKKEKPMVKIAVSIEQKDLEDLERIAKKAEVPLGQFKRNMILLGLEEARGMERVGIVGAVGFTRRKIDKVKATFSEQYKAIFRGDDGLETDQ